MQKPASTGTDDPVGPITNDQATTTTPLPPKIARLDGDVELTVPQGYRASVLLKLVDHPSGDRYYAPSAMVERHDHEEPAIAFKHPGASTIRFDVPEGMPLSAESLEPHLATFLASNNMLSPGPPIIKDNILAT